MKKSLAAAALFTIVLTGCSDTGEKESQAPAAAVATPSPTPSPTPKDPDTLEEAIAFAKEEHATDTETLHALSAARRFAEKELKPVMATEHWNEIMVFEMRTEMDMMAERSTDREFAVATQKYAVMVEEAALEAGLIR